MLRQLLVSGIIRRRVHHYHKEAFLATLSHNQNTIRNDNKKPTTTTTTSRSRRSYYHTSCKVLLQDDGAYYFANKTVMIPHDGKRHRGGEDAAAASNEFLIVADGVGGWANEGVNPANFSRTLVQTILDMGSLSSSKTTTTTTTLSTKQNLIELVHTANLKTSSQYLGSATCTVVKLLVPSSSEETDRNDENDDEDDGIITCEALNVGDSGYAIFRKYDKNTNTNDTDKDNDGNDTDTDSSSCWKLLHVSKVGQKEFNFPDQLGGNYYGDDVRRVGICNVHKLKLNDIIVVYTDGVSDNITPELFPKLFYENDETTTTNAQSSTSATTTSSNQKEVNEDGIKMMDLRDIADRIARMAYVLGKNQKFMSPFAKAAREAGWGKDYIGGKHDDITVMIAQVRSGVKPSKEEVEEGSIFMYVGTSESPSD